MHDALCDHGPCGGYRAFDDPSWMNPSVEPALDDILSDPVVRMVMRRDRLDPADVRRFIVETAENLKSGRDRVSRVPEARDA